MIAKGIKQFYKVENGEKLCYSPGKKKFISATYRGRHAFIVMRNFENQTIWKNAAASAIISGMMCWVWNGILNSEPLAEKCWKEFRDPSGLRKKNTRDLVIANEGQQFFCRRECGYDLYAGC